MLGCSKIGGSNSIQFVLNSLIKYYVRSVYHKQRNIMITLNLFASSKFISGSFDS